MLENIPENLNKELKELEAKLGIKINARETDEKDIGVSFEPRIKTTYEIITEGKTIGQYENTIIYEKDGETKVTEHGTMNLI